jgi:hypothetical protein
MRRLAVIVAAAALAVAGCGDDSTDSNGNNNDTGDASINPPPPGTFAAFVIDLIENHTADNTNPVAAEAFVSLPDPDTNNEQAFSSLFR